MVALKESHAGKTQLRHFLLQLLFLASSTLQHNCHHMNEHQTHIATVAAYRTRHQLEGVEVVSFVGNRRLQSLCHYFVLLFQCQIKDLSKIFQQNAGALHTSPG